MGHVARIRDMTKTYKTLVSKLEGRRSKWTGHIARMKYMRNTYKTLIDKPEGRHRHRWEDNIKIYIMGMG